MFNMNFKQKYKVVHITNEIGKYVIGGIGTYINELYEHKNETIGFVHLYDKNYYPDIFLGEYPGHEDILAISHEEYEKVGLIEADIIVVHYFELAFCLTEEIIKNKKVVYVVHSVPLPEPPPRDDPFGGNNHIREKFEFLCRHAHLIICVSYAEKTRLESLYPFYRDKIKVVYNGITLLKEISQNENYKKSRKVFGYIGRMHYIKGILECVKVFKHINGELRIACPNNDQFYLNVLLDYIEAADMKEQIIFYGWCTGKRKENFLRSLDALIIPSLYEPFGYVVVEAIKYGIPIITSHNGGIREIIGDYKYQYNPYSKKGLYDQIVAFQNDSNEEITQQQNLLKQRVENFKVENMIENYNLIWDELSELV